MKARALLPFAPALLLAALVALSVGGLLRAGASLQGGAAFGESFSRELSAYVLRVIAGAAFQAGLSTFCALIAGVGLALALSRRPEGAFRRIVLMLLSVATSAPSIVIVFGMVALHGRSGWLAEIAQSLGLPSPPAIYGLHGIVLAHLALNAPFVARAVFLALEQQPGERLRLAAALGFTPADMLRHIDMPVLKRELPGLAALVFLLCFTSFAIVLTLGGGPKNATLEVAIYQALKVEVDFTLAGMLALIQLIMGTGFVALLGRTFQITPVMGKGASGVKAVRPDRHVVWLKYVDNGLMLLVLALVLPPVLASLSALPHVPLLFERETAKALVTSVFLAVLAGALSVGMALWLALSARPDERGRSQRRVMKVSSLAALSLLGLPPFAFVTGLYVHLRWLGSLELLGLLLLPLVNALVALPFAYRLIQPQLSLIHERHGRLGASLGLAGWSRFRLLEWPAIRASSASAFALVAAFSLGDFGVIALFGGGDLVTLPSLLASRLGAYRMQEAGAIALVTLALVAVLAHLADHWGRRTDAEA